MFGDEFKRVTDEADPNRCQGMTAHGQCLIIAVPGGKYCKMHGGQESNQLAQKSIRNYRLLKFQARVNDFADNEQAKSLREEIGILRMVLEETLLRCEDENPEKARLNLLIESSKITDMVSRIDKLVSSCHRLELATGGLLDKSAAIQLGAQIVSVISHHIDDENIIDAISAEIMTAIQGARINEAEKPKA
jgi:hypothetical protein